MAHHVGQALLGDAVDHELDLGAHGDAVELELALDAQAVVGGRRGAQRAQRALQAEVVEHLGAQLAGDAAHVVEAAAHGLAGRGELRRVGLAGPLRRVLELEHDAGEDLADLVVQLARDPLALGLLGQQRLAPALAPLALEPVEHVVEGRRSARRRRCRCRGWRAAGRAAAARRSASSRSAGAAGAMTSRSSSMLRTTETTKPAIRITAWVSVTG